MIKKWRRKPVIIEAIQFDSNNIAEIEEFTKGQAYSFNGGMDVPTLGGTHHAFQGDFIIKGVAGEFYPCKPDIFEATYEEVKEAEGK